MANAVCESCGQERHWRAARGVRLGDLRCRCGGRLRGMTAGRASKTAGMRYTACVLCGRRRLRLRDLGVPWRERHWDRSQPPKDRTGPCCGSHEPLPVDPRAHPYDPSTRYVGGEGRPDVCSFCLAPAAGHGVAGAPCGRGDHAWMRGQRGDCPDSCPCACHAAPAP